jgi:hypothetical protein
MPSMTASGFPPVSVAITGFAAIATRIIFKSSLKNAYSIVNKFNSSYLIDI